MEIVKVIVGFLLGMISGSIFVSIPIFLFIRRPFLQRLDRLGFMTNRLPFRLVDSGAALYCFLVLGATVLAFFVDFIPLLAYWSGFAMILVTNIFCLSRGMSHPQIAEEFARDFTQHLLPGWEKIPPRRLRQCRNAKCQAPIPASSFGLIESESPFPKSGEFGFCSDDCFNTFYEGEPRD